MIEYEIVDFDGYVQWARRDDGKYAVDPLYLDKFKELVVEGRANNE